MISSNLALIIGIGDLFAALAIIVFLAFAKSSSIFSYWYRAGVWIGAIGLLYQSYKQIDIVFGGMLHAGTFEPAWALKDIGYWIIGGVMMAQSFRGRGWCPNEAGGVCLKSDSGRKLLAGENVRINSFDIKRRGK